jgi:hypothetical protein
MYPYNSKPRRMYDELASERQTEVFYLPMVSNVENIPR